MRDYYDRSRGSIPSLHWRPLRPRRPPLPHSSRHPRPPRPRSWPSRPPLTVTRYRGQRGCWRQATSSTAPETIVRHCGSVPSLHWRPLRPERLLFMQCKDRGATRLQIARRRDLSQEGREKVSNRDGDVTPATGAMRNQQGEQRSTEGPGRVVWFVCGPEASLYVSPDWPIGLYREITPDYSRYKWIIVAARVGA